MPDFYDDLCERAECELCDDKGMNGMFVCDHIDYAATAKRGMALIRETLKGSK